MACEVDLLLLLLLLLMLLLLLLLLVVVMIGWRRFGPNNCCLAEWRGGERKKNVQDWKTVKDVLAPHRNERLVWCMSAEWPDLAKFRNFGKHWNVLGIFMRVYLAFGKYCYLLWQILYTIGQFFMVVNGQIMKTTKAIWSHCFRGLSSYLYSRKINLFLSFSAF